MHLLVAHDTVTIVLLLMLKVRRHNGVHTSRVRKLFSVVATCGCILLEKRGCVSASTTGCTPSVVAMAVEAMVTTGAQNN